MKKEKIFIKSLFLLLTCFSCYSSSKTLTGNNNVNLFNKDIIVSNQNELIKAIYDAKPGDVVVMKDGIWTDVNIDFSSMATEKDNITLRAQNPGKVILNGNSTLKFSKPYLIADGLLFKQGAISAKGISVIRFNSDHCRLTNCAIVDYNPEDFKTDYYWVFFEGSHNRMDHCFLSGKSNMKPVIQNDEEGARYNKVDRCYIKDIPYIEKANGREILRIFGYGHADQTGDDGAYFVIENNLFDHAHGEGTEIVSLKSNHNVVRNNTVIASKGGLVGRRGKFNTFEGNFILGKGEKGTSGIRVAGSNHRVVNNYIQDVVEDGLRLITGEYYDKSLTDNFAPKKKNLPKYLQVQNGYFAHNTLINCGENGMYIGFSYKNDWPDLQMVLFPENNNFVNNLVYNCKQNAINIEDIDKLPPLDIFNFKPNYFKGNIVFGKSVSNGSLPAGVIDIDPILKVKSDGLFHLEPKSPAINTADFSDVSTDISGNPRKNKNDIGAEEYIDQIKVFRPLTANEVGPDWMINKLKEKLNNQ
jgi:poly(beta-D-mannuronate) lyase